jgi:selenide,water dikinase
VTGFSLLGHAVEVAAASGVGLRFSAENIPFVACAHKYAEMGTFPGGAADNRMYFGPQVRFAAGIDEQMEMLLFDPQTSGGLLLGVPQKRLADLLKRAAETQQPAWVIGETVKGEGIEVV